MCAAPMRPRAGFCHRCGSPYPEESAVIYKTNHSSPETRELTALEKEDSTNNHTGFAAPSIVEEKNSEISVDEPAPDSSQDGAVAETAAPAEIEKPAAETETPIEETEKNLPKTELNRRKRRVMQTPEYVWEESNTDPTWRLALITAVALIFVFLILWLGRFIHF